MNPFDLSIRIPAFIEGTPNVISPARKSSAGKKLLFIFAKKRSDLHNFCYCLSGATCSHTYKREYRQRILQNSVIFCNRRRILRSDDLLMVRPSRPRIDRIGRALLGRGVKSNSFNTSPLSKTLARLRQRPHVVKPRSFPPSPKLKVLISKWTAVVQTQS